ncbi:hypothetical protein BJN34_15090 [Cupriavidus necator]|uniref:Pyrimidine utilization protein C n=1 Tax=Cupriavidus necator TaxID=106590 RepID=A0A1U9URD3_CUPNE|nr:RidA family protein [Cupriavidus necator]AQV95203.1 hypothetical protein BJN34_15090 [Cupriavidus necator]
MNAPAPALDLPSSALYSYARRAGQVIYTAGIVAINAEGQTVGVGDAGAQTRHILQSIQSILAAHGVTLADVVSNWIFVKNFDDYAAVNAVYAEFFKAPMPVRYCIRADLVRNDWLVEIASVAHSA